MTSMDHGAQVAAIHGLSRSPEWPKVEHAFCKANPTCAACDSKLVQVHHVLPFHFAILLGRPDLELDPRNLITLCEDMNGQETSNHHLLLGHLDDFKSYNKDVRAYVTSYHGMGEQTIVAVQSWLDASHHKPPDWAVMTSADKTALRTLMDTWYPLEKGGSHGSQSTTSTGTSGPSTGPTAH